LVGTCWYPVTAPVFAVPHAAGAGRLLAAAGCGKWPPCQFTSKKYRGQWEFIGFE